MVASNEPGESLIQRVTDELLPLYLFGGEDQPGAVLDGAPNPVSICRALELLVDVIFPGRLSSVVPTREGLAPFLGEHLREARSLLCPAVEAAIRYRVEGAAAKQELRDPLPAAPAGAEQVVDAFLSRLPEVRRQLVQDVQATYDGDPAALTFAEIQGAYPGVLAIASHRLAHLLYKLDVPILPRVMSEWTHTKTGVDIHPGATIGLGFFIDHGTGIVIGETAVVGDRVRIYQGATLGAKTFALDEHGLPVKHVKRHPTVEDDVVIYANAVILGGDTVIGARSTIGAGVFVMASVPPDSIVVAKRPELQFLRPR